jgi:hypothetical protein
VNSTNTCSRILFFEEGKNELIKEDKNDEKILKGNKDATNN